MGDNNMDIKNEVREEIERVCEIKEGEAILLIDYATWFPYSNPEIIDMGVEFIFLPDTENILKDDIKPSFTLNTRYPNKNYLTLSRKEGRRKCRVGYPLVLPVSIMNKLKFINFYIGTKSHGVIKLCIPVNCNFTNDNYFSYIAFRTQTLASASPELENEIELQIFQASERGWTSENYSYHYHRNKDRFKPFYIEPLSEEGERAILLSPAPDEFFVINGMPRGKEFARH